MDARIQELETHLADHQGRLSKVLLGVATSLVLVSIFFPPFWVALWTILLTSVSASYWIVQRRSVAELIAAIPAPQDAELHDRMARIEEERDRLKAEVEESSKQIIKTAAAVRERSLSDLAENYGLSLRNVLSYTDTLLGLLMEKMGTDPTFRSWVTRLEAEAEPVKSFCESSLVLSASWKSKAQRLDLNSLVLRTTGLLSSRMLQMGIKVTMDLAKDLQTVRCAPYRLAIAILDILGNAQDALEGRRTPWLNLKTWRDEEHIYLDITDSRAIPRAKLSRVYSTPPLFGEYRIEDRYGYSVAATLLEDQKVEFDILSQEMKNTTTVRLTFQVGTDDLPEADYLRLKGRSLLTAMNLATEGHIVRVSTGPVSTAPTLNGCKIMVVDPDQTVTDSVADVLREEGAVVERVHDVKKGRATLATERFDLIITDFSMSGMDPHSFIQKLAYNPKAASRFIFLAAPDADEEITEFIREFKFPLLTKPVGVEILLQTARDALERLHEQE